jgi:hypothetical protein
MIELTAWSDVLRGLGIVYWLLALGALALALNKPKSGKNKAIAAAVVLGVFGSLPFTGWLEGRKLKQAYQVQKTLFDERCKNAGVKIYKTVENVEGVLLLKVRPTHGESDWSNQMLPGATFAHEVGGVEYIETFLLNAERHGVSARPSDRPGYRYVDVIENGQRYRYHVEITKQDDGASEKWATYRSKLIREQTDKPLPQYAITFEDDLNPADRKEWVAGSTVQILDTTTKEILGEYTSYAMETGRGSTNQRSPWLLAFTCGNSGGSSDGTQTRYFVDQVLKPAAPIRK